MTTFFIPVLVAVDAESQQEAEAEVTGLMNYAFEVSNDEGKFKSHELIDKQDCSGS